MSANGTRQAAAFAAALLCLGGLVLPGPARALASSQASDPAFTVSLPLVADERRLPSILVETTVRDLIRLSPAGLAAALDPLISPAAREQIAALGPDLTPVEDLQALGLVLRLNPQTLAIEVDIPVAMRAARDTSLAGDWAYWDEDALHPDTSSFGVTAALQIADTLSDGQSPSADLGFDGFANLGGFGGISLDWGGRLAVRSDGETDVRRNRIFAFMDRPGEARRWSAGDLTPQLARNTGVLNLLGVSVERNYQDLQPTRNIRPAGDRSLILDRRSTVEVYVNGALIDRFVAEPGPINLRDIPLANIANDVSIIVEDGLGRREIDNFSLSADVSLLAPGLTESVWSAGFQRNDLDGDFDYDFDAPVFGGQITRGFRADLTGSASAALTPDVTVVGGALAHARWGGVAQLDVTVSDADLAGQGFAAGLNFRGGPYLGPDRYGTLNLRVNYFSTDFAYLNDRASDSATRWSAGGDFRFNLTDETALNLGAFYQDAHTGSGRSTTLSAGLNRRLGDFILSTTARHTQFQSRENETGLFLTLSRRLGARNLVTASYDSIAETGRLEYRRARGEGLPNMNARASVVQQEGRTDIRGMVATESSRYIAQLDAAHQPAGNGLDDRTSLAVRLQSGLAWADGAFGVGRDPGRGFAIVDRHDTLSDATISVSRGAGDRPIARADRLGPAVIRLASPYRPEHLRIGATGLEPGYNIGPGRYTLVPGALTGTRITVGTDAFRTAVATLVFDGEPLVLQYGSLINLETDEVHAFFTNRSGRAAFNALVPGRYRATLPGEGGVVVEFEIEPRAPAYVDLGRLETERQS